jgi:ribosome-interacting GTPase 1
MPINAGPEYSEAERKFLAAKSREEKIFFLEEMIRTLPKHKGTENALALLKKRLSKLKLETGGRASSKPSFVIKKEGAARIAVMGETQVGKSTMLKILTNAHVKVGSHPFTTKEPEVGMMFYEDVPIQLVEIPSTFEPEFMSIAHGSDILLVIIKDDAQKEKMKKVLERFALQRKKIVFVRDWEKIEDFKGKLWRRLKKIRVYTQSPGKQKDLPPVTMKPGSTVRDLARQIHKDFLKDFRFARVFNNTMYSGQKVGMKYVLHDMDVVEIHTG